MCGVCCVLQMSMLEVYQERVRDLLDYDEGDRKTRRASGPLSPSKAAAAASDIDRDSLQIREVSFTP